MSAGLPGLFDPTMSMSKRLRILVRTAVFTAVFLPAVTPSWWLMEKLWTRDVSSAPEIQTHLFAVLVRRPDRANQYAIDFYPGLDPQSKLVTDFAEQDLAQINRDLRASISDESSKYVYCKVPERGQGYVDVSLETPTTRDFWRKNSYRIQNGDVHPQRILLLGPFFGMTVAVVAAIAGVLAVFGCEVLIRRRS
jgi:hypothetical protein